MNKQELTVQYKHFLQLLKLAPVEAFVTEEASLLLFGILDKVNSINLHIPLVALERFAASHNLILRASIRGKDCFYVVYKPGIMLTGYSNDVNITVLDGVGTYTPLEVYKHMFHSKDKLLLEDYINKLTAKALT